MLKQQLEYGMKETARSLSHYKANLQLEERNWYPLEYLQFEPIRINILSKQFLLIYFF